MRVNDKHPSLSGGNAGSVIAGLAVGIGFIALFSLFLPAAIQPNLEPQISEKEAVEIAKAEVAKNKWYFNFPQESNVAVLDFKETNYYPESEFFEQGHRLPLTLLFANGTIVDINGDLSEIVLPMCYEEIGYWYCEFVFSMHNSADLKEQGALAYFVQLDWENASRGDTGLFIIDASNGRMINSTIYTTPVIELAEVESELVNIGKPKLTSEEAISIVMDDLAARNIEVDNLHVQYDRLERHIPVNEFYTRNYSLPLLFIHESGNIIFVNDDQPTMGYYCNSPNISYCSFLPPYDFDMRSRLVYGVDLMWNQGSAIYAVDAVTGEIIDSSYLRIEASRG